MGHSARFLVAVSLALLLMAGPARARQSFPSPDEASSALVDAARTRKPGFVDRIFGPNVLNRTIGENELRAIEACQAYIAAQREYIRTDHDGDQVLEYAQRLISRPDKRDGLYWQRTGQADVSPLEGRLSEALLERENRTYAGYRFRILTEQGPSAPGGAHSYIINGNMIAGFGLVAWPAEWGKTGVMTFICGHSGVVLQKNLGPKTSEMANRLLLRPRQQLDAGRVGGAALPSRVADDCLDLRVQKGHSFQPSM